jgi:hypothetical protein
MMMPRKRYAVRAGWLLIVLVSLATRVLATESWLYWSHPTGIGRSRLDGSDSIAELVSGFQVEGVAASADRDRLLWSDLPPTVPAVPSGIVRSSRLDGSGIELLTGQLPHPSAVALDEIRGLVYWTDLETMEIQRASLQGSPVETVLPAQMEISELGGLVIDPDNDALYFSYVNPLIDSIYAGAIGRLDLESSAVDNVVVGLSHPQGVALHQGHLFWADDLLATGGVIGRVELESGEQELIVKELQSPVGVAIDRLSEHIYWADRSSGMIQRANLDGSAQINVLTGLDQPRAVALAVVPEPSTGLLLLFGCQTCLVRMRRTRHARSGSQTTKAQNGTAIEAFSG